MFDLKQHFKDAIMVGAPLVAAVALSAFQQDFNGCAMAGAGAISAGFYFLEEKFSWRAKAFRQAQLSEPPQRLQQLYNKLRREADVHVRMALCEGGELETNAVAFPNAVWLGKKLIAMLDEREVAFVIGHELAHIRLRHGEKHAPWVFQARTLSSSMFWAAGAYYAATSVGKMVGYDLPPVDPSINLIVAANWGYQALLSNIESHHREFEADKAALLLTNDLEAAGSFFEKIKRFPRNRWDLMGTHPSPQRRLETLEKWSTQVPALKVSVLTIDQ